MRFARVAITGATGPLGLALVDYYLARGVAVTAIVHPGSARISYLPTQAGLGVVFCDLASLGTLGALLPTDHDAFFHLGWSDTENHATRNDPVRHANNILYTLEAVKLTKALGCSVFVGAGSHIEKAGVAPDCHTEREESYGIAKYAAGRLSAMLCEQMYLRYCWGRVLSIYGPGERETTALMYCIGTLLKGEKPSFTAGEQLWDYLYAVDCARAFALMAEKGRHGAVYDVGSGTLRPLKEYFALTRDAINPALPLGLGEKPYLPGQPMRMCFDVNPLRTDTGFSPKTTFEEGIRETIKWVETRQGVKTGA